MEDDKLGCDSDNGFSGIPWTSQFTPINNSLQKGAENLTFSAGECSSHEFEQFAAFFQKFITVVREFFLPPERHRFAVVLERSLLPFINNEEPGSWFITVYFAGCPSCSQVLKEVDDLRTVIQAQASNVLEASVFRILFNTLHESLSHQYIGLLKSYLYNFTMVCDYVNTA